jgi:drug/metabolite transporter (DMT)-like permease
MPSVPSALGDAMAIGCAVAWALAVLAFRRLRDVDPVALNTFKNVLASALLVVTMIALGIPIDRERGAWEWVALALSGVLGLAVADTLFLAGLRRVDASVAAVADCAYSPTVLLLSATFLAEPLRWSLLVGAPLVVTGLAVIGWERRPGAPPIDRRGLLLCVAGVVTTAVAVVIAQPALQRSDLVEATTVRLIAGAAALFLSQAMLGRSRAALALFRPQPAWRAAIPGTLLGTYVAMILWLGGMKYGTPSRAALLNQSGAIFVLLFARFAGEPVTPRRWIGAGIALAGVVIVATR